MKGFIISIFFVLQVLSFSSVASATVYRCESGGEIVYAAHPCGKHAVKLNLKQRDDSISFVTARMPAKPKPAKAEHAAKREQHQCPIDLLSSTQLRNLRVSHVIMVCESAAGVRAAWGKPDVIRHELSRGHVHEHWIYKNARGKQARSVSLEDGKVVSFEK